VPMSTYVDSMKQTTTDLGELATNVRSDDPTVGLRAVVALRRLAEQVENRQVRLARLQGWSWEQIGDALGVSRQAAHKKHGR
jgi:hypothetical protein